MDLRSPHVNQLLDIWIAEDIGRGDLTRVVLDSRIGSAHWMSKQKGVFCGGALVAKLFTRLDSSIKVKLLLNDWENIQINQKQVKIKNNGVNSVIINYGNNLKETINNKGKITFTI